MAPLPFPTFGTLTRTTNSDPSSSGTHCLPSSPCTTSTGAASSNSPYKPSSPHCSRGGIGTTQSVQAS
eukprot:CAMPEP_0183811104 /NCGR_PEP_ID=MMETSP0803_2-20130417/48733_1 /TAXON_ID=195967 /ORGANISM="Crustomastix stigmata, Strain CCMP3273" /LENGTH=67 /DNA_ID=CAMNT_0026055931 /DNA_START=77 /DNA_END=277 /DNA_ORIENTATION=-